MHNRYTASDPISWCVFSFYCSTNSWTAYILIYSLRAQNTRKRDANGISEWARRLVLFTSLHIARYVRPLLRSVQMISLIAWLLINNENSIETSTWNTDPDCACVRQCVYLFSLLLFVSFFFAVFFAPLLRHMTWQHRLNLGIFTSNHFSRAFEILPHKLH